MKNLKPVPADKKKSLGKLPTDVRNKMGYAQKGKMMSNRDKRQEEITKKQNPKSEYKKDKFGKVKLSYTEAKKGKMITGKKEEDDVSKYVKSIKLPEPGDIFKEMKNPFFKPKGKSMGGEMMKAKKGKDVKLMENISKESIVGKGALKTSKKSMGGEMKQGYGAARTSGMGLQDEDLIPGKSMDYYKDLM